MVPKSPPKRFDKLGYGAFALYVALMGVMALGLYGINVTSLLMDQSRSARERAQVRNGRMLVLTDDRTQCRSIRFDNETAELGREALVDCDARQLGMDSGTTIGVVRDGFIKR
jgi:hypothetical protein